MRVANWGLIVLALVAVVIAIFASTGAVVTVILMVKQPGWFAIPVGGGVLGLLAFARIMLTQAQDILVMMKAP